MRWSHFIMVSKEVELLDSSRTDTHYQKELACLVHKERIKSAHDQHNSSLSDHSCTSPLFHIVHAPLTHFSGDQCCYFVCDWHHTLNFEFLDSVLLLSKRIFTCLTHKKESSPHIINGTPLFRIVHAPLLYPVTSVATMYMTGAVL